jgi:hypothetical protein
MTMQEIKQTSEERKRVDASDPDLDSASASVSRFPPLPPAGEGFSPKFIASLKAEIDARGEQAETAPAITPVKLDQTGVTVRNHGNGSSLNFEKPATALASQPAAQNLKFEREDWSLFRTVEGLQQKAGVARGKLARLVLKELADNGLDEGAAIRIGDLPDGGYFVEDDGRGIDGTPEDIAQLFSIARPMISTKLLRLPTRGALGNGLRVVAGTVLASEGSLVVITRNRRIVLRPERDGSTTVISAEPVEFSIGTRIEIRFGPALPPDAHARFWAEEAILMSRSGRSYAGKSSPWWYDTPQFLELLYASGATPVRELVANLDGCTGAKAGEIVAAAGLGRAICGNVTRQQAAKLLQVARENARQVNPERLGAVEPKAFPDFAYAYACGTVRLGSTQPLAEIPYVVEAWVAPSSLGKTVLSACVNRTPVTGNIHVSRDDRNIDVFGCGLSHVVAQAPKTAHFVIRFNVTTPYMPITSDGKAPDLKPFLDEIFAAVGKAVKKAHRPNAGSGKSQKDIVLDNLDTVIADVSGGEFRFNPRQLLYALRPIVKNEIDKQLKLENFTTIITDYENEHGEIPLMYREPRGSIYHPHRNETITLGTLMVEDYERPAWVFNKVVYIEKEGFSEALKDAHWAERHDCMLMSSKGFSTRAARDLVDKLAVHDEPVTIFCVHDADASGGMIYQTFQRATKARVARKIKIVNLGLEPWEAITMGLEVETVEEGKKHKPVADYALNRGDEEDWDEWLQTHRIELNAMTTPEFIEWLDGKMAAYDKLIPPPDVLKAELDERIERKLRADITERILREAGFEDQVAAAIAAINKPPAADLQAGIKHLFEQDPDREWRDHIEEIASNTAEKAGGCKSPGIG